MRGCERCFPPAVSTLTLNGNDLGDLAEVSFLSGMTGLEQLTIADNPCIVQPDDERKQYDYRPYVINWCLSLRVLDGVIIGAKERFVSFVTSEIASGLMGSFLLYSLKAEWMYSQSRGRHFTVGQHEELLAYLLSVCPLHPDEDWEEDKKLNLILSKVQEHQQSLREPSSAGRTTILSTFCQIDDK